jgi:hypothetical protein
MDKTTLLALLALAGAFAAPIGTYLVAARRYAGRIATSDAAALWKESGEMRQHLTERLDAAYTRIEALEADARRQREEHRDEVKALESRIVTLEEDNATLRRENTTREHDARALEERIVTLEADNATLRRENTMLRSRVQELERHTGDTP